MSILTLVWAAAVGFLIGGAALALEAALRHRRRPARGVWAAALVITVAAPWWGPALTEIRAARDVAALDALVPDSWDAGAGSAAGPHDAVAPRLPLAGLAEARPAVVVVWAAAAALMLLLVGAAMVRLHRRVERLPRARVGGDEVTLAPDFGPACVGIGRARIVLPRWILALDRRALDLVLRHERSHGDAHDPLLLASGLLAVALAPWNPALWWQMVRLRKAVELDCDRRVLASGAPAGAYGRVLLAVLGRERGLMAFPAPALLESASFLERRLTLMRSRLRIPPHRTALALALAAGLGALACETPAPTAISPAERSETDPSAQAVMETIEIEGIGRVPADAVIIVDGEVVSTKEVFDRVERVAESVRQYDVDGRTVVEVTTIDAEPLEREKQPFTVREVTGAEKPLIILDGVITDNAIADIATFDVKAIEVVKGPAARALYGERAKVGAVLITTRGGERATTGAVQERKVPFTRSEPVRVPLGTVDGVTQWSDTDTDALVVVDGVILSDGVAALKRMMEDDPDGVASIEVVKGAAATELYGSRARHGVIRVTTKR